MDVLKKQLNDIGSCIGYPFYFFEDGSFSHTFVCGKMNACLVIKGAFAESDKCFFASAKIAKLSEIKALEKGWTQKTVVPNTVNWFKKYLNDIGTTLNYPFYVFDDGAYAKTSSLKGKQVVLYVKQPFTSVEGDFIVSSLNRDEKLNKINNTSSHVFRILAGESVSDKELLHVIENEPYEVVKRCVFFVWKKLEYRDIFSSYRLSFLELIKKNWWDIYCFDKQEFKWFCLYEIPCNRDKDVFFRFMFLYANVENLDKILGICLYGGFSYSILDKHYCIARYMDRRREKFMQSLKPLRFLETGNLKSYIVYRKYARQFFDPHLKDEFNAILEMEAIDFFKILLYTSTLTTDCMGMLVRSGNMKMIFLYCKICGVSTHFQQLLRYSGNAELLELADNPQKVLRTVFQNDKEFSNLSRLIKKL